MFSSHLPRQLTLAIWVFRMAVMAAMAGLAAAMAVMRLAVAADIIAAVRRAGVEAATHLSLNVVGSSARTTSGVSRAAVAVITVAMAGMAAAMAGSAAAMVEAIIRPLTPPARMEAGSGMAAIEALGHALRIAVRRCLMRHEWRLGT